MNRGNLVGAVVLGLVGLGLLVCFFFVFSSTLSFRSRSTSAAGVVVELVESRGEKGDALYKPVVRWCDARGAPHRLVGSVASSPPSCSRGDIVSVRYIAADPEHARIDGFMENWLLSLISGFLGAGFAAIGGGIFAWELRRKRNFKWLRAHGTRVQANFKGVIMEGHMKVNGHFPWRLTAQWQNPSDGTVYSFKSDPIWFDPTRFVNRETLEVVVNPDNPSVYAVDIGFLPKQAG